MEPEMKGFGQKCRIILSAMAAECLLYSQLQNKLKPSKSKWDGLGLCDDLKLPCSNSIAVASPQWCPHIRLYLWLCCKEIHRLCGTFLDLASLQLVAHSINFPKVKECFTGLCS